MVQVVANRRQNNVSLLFVLVAPVVIWKNASALFISSPEPSYPHLLGNFPSTAETESKRAHERRLLFDTAAFPLCELVAESLGGGSGVGHIHDLSKLHLYEPEDFCALGRIRCGNARTRTNLRRVELLRRALTERWKSSPQKRIWEEQYLPQIVREVIGTNVFPEENVLIYQRAPMLRFHVAWPLEKGDDEDSYDSKIPPENGRNPGTLAAVHTDGDYGHPKGEVNFLLPVTQTYGTNSLFVEGTQGQGDFKPFDLNYGEMMQWNGNGHRHCSPRNISNHTRVSFDFRVIPGSMWEEPETKSSFQLGRYYMDAFALS